MFSLLKLQKMLLWENSTLSSETINTEQNNTPGCQIALQIVWIIHRARGEERNYYIYMCLISVFNRKEMISNLCGDQLIPWLVFLCRNGIKYSFQPLTYDHFLLSSDWYYSKVLFLIVRMTKTRFICFRETDGHVYFKCLGTERFI